MKPFTKITSVFFAIAGLIHLYRILFPFRVIIGNYEIPNLASVLFLVMAIIISIGLWKESNKISV